jgi:Xaa-Pro aminopeptidase
MSEGSREERLRVAQAAAGMDAIVCRLPENVLLLSGYWPMNGLSFAWLPTTGQPVLIVPHDERAWAEAGRWSEVRTFGWGTVDDGDPLDGAATHLRDLRRRLATSPSPARIGFEGSFESVAPPHVSGEAAASALPTRDMLEAVFGAAPVDATTLLNEQRAVKTPEELDGIRGAVTVADLGCQVFRWALERGTTETEVAAAVENTIHAHGIDYADATRARGWATVLAGRESVVAGRSFQVSRMQRIKEGESAVLELGVVVDGFWADLTRTYVVGEPSARQREIHAVVLAAHDAAIAAIRPGVTGSAVDQAAREVITAAGFGSAFRHQTGHGLGFRYHEPLPLLHPRYDRPLAANMVVTVEPGIYLPGEFGLRIEDDVLVTETGAESLSHASRDLYMPRDRQA